MNVLDFKAAVKPGDKVVLVISSGRKTVFSQGCIIKAMNKFKVLVDPLHATGAHCLMDSINVNAIQRIASITPAKVRVAKPVNASGFITEDGYCQVTGNMCQCDGENCDSGCMELQDYIDFSNGIQK